MNEKPNAAVARIKNFVNRNKVPITAFTTIVASGAVFVKVHGETVRRFNEFLDEHGLKDEFYNRTEI